MDRRSFVATLGLAATGAAGCTSSSGDRATFDQTISDEETLLLDLSAGETVTIEVTIQDGDGALVALARDRDAIGVANDELIDEAVDAGTETLTATVPETTTYALFLGPIGDVHFRVDVAPAAE